MSVVEQFLQELLQLDINITLCGEEISIDAPKGILTIELVTQIRDNKPAIVAAMRGANQISDRHNRPNRPYRPSGTSPEPRRRDTAAEWDQKTVALVRWFIDEGQHLIPAEPFQLTKWITITKPDRFKEAMLFDISMGPDGLRSRIGSLQENLRRIKERLMERTNGSSFDEE